MSQPNESLGAQLPSKFHVELVGITSLQEKAAVWWRPDGGIMQTDPTAHLKLSFPSTLPIKDAFLFLFSVNGPGKAAPSYRFALSESRAVYNEIPVTNKSEEQNLTNMVAICCLFPKDHAKEVDVHLGLNDSGQRVLASWDASRTMPFDYPGGGVVFHKPREEKGSLVICSTNTDYTPIGETCLAIYDRNGMLHRQTGGTSARSAGFISSESQFANLRADDVRSVELRAKFFEWAIFKGISLQPGHTTNPRVHVLSRADLRLGTAAPKSGNVGHLVGKKVESFELTGADGKTYRLADYANKVVLLHFFATWCVSCHAEMPHLLNLHKQYGDRGLTVMAISWKDSQNKIFEYARKQSLPFPVLFDRADTVLTGFPDESGHVSLPTNILIDRSGKVIYADRGFGDAGLGDLRRNIESVLAVSSQPAP